MKHVNIRDDNDNRPKKGTYARVRADTSSSKIRQLEKRSEKDIKDLPGRFQRIQKHT